MIKCVVFDFDGTLVDSNDLKRQAFFDIACRHSAASERLMKQALDSMTGGRKEVFLEYVRCMKESGISLDADELTNIYSHEIDRRVAAVREIPGATELLQTLRRQEIRIHLSSATPEKNLLAILQWRGWMDRFDGIHGLPRKKTEILQKILQTESLCRRQVAVVGDGHDDKCAAEAIGCYFIPVAVGTCTLCDADNDNFALSEVVARLEELTQRGVLNISR